MSEAPGPERVAEFLEQLSRMAGGETHLRMPLSDRRDWLDSVAYGINVVAGELTFLKELAEKANQAKSVFLANTSHELRTPITAMVGTVDILMRYEFSPEERREHFQRIKDQGMALTAIVDDILDLSRVEAGRVELVRDPIESGPFAREVLAAFETRAAKKGLALKLDLESSVLPPLRADKQRLRQIVSNLVGNAIKFTNQGQVELSVGAHRDALGQLFVRFNVADTGIGISGEQVGRLFRLFSQGDETIRRRYGGTGLGLLLSRRLAELMNGRLDLHSSQEGVGSTFRLLIPSDAEALATPRALEEPVGHVSGLQSIKVLLVEDNAEIRKIMRLILEVNGMVVTEAADGLAGVELAEHGGHDVVLMDVQMPGLDGLSAVRRLRGRGYGGKIIAVTAHAMAEHRDQCLAAGYDDFVTKPIPFDLLLEKIAAHCVTA